MASKATIETVKVQGLKGDFLIVNRRSIDEHYARVPRLLADIKLRGWVAVVTVRRVRGKASYQVWQGQSGQYSTFV